MRSSPPSRYYTHPATARYLVRSSPDYCGGILALNNDRSYLSFQYLEQALATGKLPEEAGARIPSIHDVFGGSGHPVAAAVAAAVAGQPVAAAAVKDGSPIASAGIAASGAVSEHFSVAMMGASLGNFRCLARAFDFGSVRSVGDMGGSNGCLSACLCQVMLWPTPGIPASPLTPYYPPHLAPRTPFQARPHLIATSYHLPPLPSPLIAGTHPPDCHQL